MLVACFLFRDIAIVCESARLLHLRHEPFIVAMDELVVAVSEAASHCGIRANMSVTATRSLCSSLIILPYDRAAYVRAMESVWDLLAVESSTVEPVSPESCFVQMEGRDILERTQQLVSAVSDRIGIAVHVGLANTKLVAHQAALQSKPGKLLAIRLGDEPYMLTNVPLHALGKLDRKQLQRLERLGVKTLGDLSRLPPQELQRQFKQMSWLMQRLAHGEDGERVRRLWPPRSIGFTFGFGDEAIDLGSISHALAECSDHIACSLARRVEYCRALKLVARFAGDTWATQEERLKHPLHTSKTIYRAGLRLFERMTHGRPWKEPATELTLTASDLSVGSAIQLSLLDGNAFEHELPHEHLCRLEEALSHIRSRFGSEAITPLKLRCEARRIDLWRTPLVRRRHERVHVEVDQRGMPVRFWRGSRAESASPMEINVRDIWKETAWFWGENATAYLVESAGDGLYEIHHRKAAWFIAGISD